MVESGGDQKKLAEIARNFVCQQKTTWYHRRRKEGNKGRLE